MPAPQLVWFRNDLRVADHRALAAAAAAGPVHAVFLKAEAQWAAHGVGANRLAFLERNLRALAAALGVLGIPFTVLEAPRFRDAPGTLLPWAQAQGATALHFNDEYPLNERRRDDAVARAFAQAGVAVHRYTDSVIAAPGTLKTGQGGPYTVFTPFKRRWLATLDLSSAAPLAPPDPQGPVRPLGPALEEAMTLAGAAASAVPAKLWPGGEGEAHRRLTEFLAEAALRYDSQRDFPAVTGTSTLSPYLSLGVLSPRQVLSALLAAFPDALEGSGGPSIWLSELIWREFYRHVVAAFDHVSKGEAFRPAFADLPWRQDPEGLAAWKAGRTGLPLVDAGMRELAATGWMHNRVRMAVAMFLTKNLLIDWHLGEAHFMDQLVDGDFAANNGGWQWSAATGTDAAPYFRVFNPVTQSQRFDPEGHYLRRWVPELAGLDARSIHEPWRYAGGPKAYPKPLVDLKASRERAIAHFKAHAAG